MVKRIGTARRKTRHKLQIKAKYKGKIPLSKYFQKFVNGDKVNLKVYAGVQKGRFFPRFHGMTGTVSGQKGSCYEVTIKDGGKTKRLFIHPIHLSK